MYDNYPPITKEIDEAVPIISIHTGIALIRLKYYIE